MISVLHDAFVGQGISAFWNALIGQRVRALHSAFCFLRMSVVCAVDMGVTASALCKDFVGHGCAVISLIMVSVLYTTQCFHEMSVSTSYSAKL